MDRGADDVYLEFPQLGAERKVFFVQQDQVVGSMFFVFLWWPVISSSRPLSSLPVRRVGDRQGDSNLIRVLD